ncbi:MAG: alpha/beta family hydrolase [Pseudomonadota bacterium]
MATKQLPDYLRWDGERSANRILVLAHGAGAPMDSPFMDAVALGVVKHSGHAMAVVRFEFAYMAARRVDGKRRGPDRPAMLEARWHDVIEHLTALGERPMVIGGKSMGGRIASMVADDLSADGLVCLGYPFHPAGKPERTRTEHLATLKTQTLMCQGERDPLGTRAEVEGYTLANTIRISWYEDGNHDLKPRKSSGFSETEHLERLIREVTEFCGDGD